MAIFTPLAYRRAPSELWRHVAIGLVSCSLTVAILGSPVYLALRRLDKSRERARIQQIVDSLRHRSPAEIDQSIAILRERPSLAGRVLPLILRRVRDPHAPSELRLAGLRILGAFVPDEPRIARLLFDLRLAPDESLAAEAIDLLARQSAAPRAVEYLGKCLDDPIAPAVVDVACERLVALAAPGRAALAPRLPRLSVDRRIWLVGLLCDRRPHDLQEWLDLLANDPDPAVRKHVGAARSATADVVAAAERQEGRP